VEFGTVAATLRDAVENGACPGAVILVSRGGETVYHAAFGVRNLDEPSPVELDTIFDLSSLTKPLATALAAMLLLQEGKLGLDDRVTRFLPNFGVHGKSHVTVRHLLAHCSGLAKWRPYYKEIVSLERQGRLNFVASRAAKEFVYDQLNRERAEYDTCSRAVYSDLGFMVLGELVELIGYQPLDRFCRDRIFRPLGMRATGFVDLAELRQRKVSPVTEMIAATEMCPWREKLLCGEVHDDNAYAMGGVAGHAGLFSNAGDVDRVVGRLRACWRGEDDFVAAEIVRHFWSRDTTVADSTWALGWDTPTPGESTAGRHISANAVGHLGFTGTSVWIDLERDAYVILLTNRVHPRRDNERLRAVRPAVHDAVLEALDA
jgi:CubicO group peptidase (beta-lactamase class C family)